jgi:propanol-preferring alcohol dehydrogenase
MLAAILDSPGSIESKPLRLCEVPIPQPGADEALIRVCACGVCRTDLHVVEGELPPQRKRVIPGHQVVGVVERLGASVTCLQPGDRVGVAWLHRTCGRCAYCARGRENLCERAEFTGYTVNGGFAQYMVAAADFVYPLPQAFSDTQIAPLLCAGIIGYRAMRAAEVARGTRLGIYGFGAAGHVIMQLARGRGARVFVCTRDQQRHQALAKELGATWVGGASDQPPEPLDAAVIFAPAGELVPHALAALDKGGTLVLGGIHMSDIPAMPYQLLYGERVIRSVANNTRDDGRNLLREAAALPVRTRVEVFDLARVNDALLALKRDAVRGAAVLSIPQVTSA